MSTMDIYHPQSRLHLQGDVVAVTSLYRDSQGRNVFSVVIEDVQATSRSLALKQEANRIPVFFYGDWAEACSFIAIGDSLEVHKFTVDSGSVLSTSPFVAIVDADSEVKVTRKRQILINATNVGTFRYEEEAEKTGQSYEEQLFRGHNLFTKMGAYYDAIFGRREDKPRFDFLLSVLHGYYVHTALDCGCGTGLAAFFLREFGISVTGVDASETLISVARQKNAYLQETQQIPFHVEDITQFRLVSKTKDGNPQMQTFDCVICLDTLQYLPDMHHIRMAMRAFWNHVRVDGHLVIDVPNSRMQRDAPKQDTKMFSITRRDLTALGNLMLLDEGTLDIVQRSFLDDMGCYRINEWHGFAQQYDKQKKAKYYSNWLERFDEFLYDPEELELLIEAEGFHIVAIYGDQLGGDFDPHSSTHRYYVCARKFMGSPEEME